MTLPSRKTVLLLSVVAYFAFEVGAWLLHQTIPDGLSFGIAAVVLFRFGRPLQMHAIGQLRRLRLTSRTVLWFFAAVAFWYSVVIWVWWSRRVPNFPLFLLNGELLPSLFFSWVPVFVFAGLGIQEREQRADSRGVR